MTSLLSAIPSKYLGRSKDVPVMKIRLQPSNSPRFLTIFPNETDIQELKNKRSYYIINGLTWYRIVAAPILILLVFMGQLDIFKWLLGISFFTDLIDGPLARRFKVTTVSGSKLDSIGDDLTVAAALIGLLVFRIEFIEEQKIIFIVLLAIFAVQTIAAYLRYGRMTSFHTYLAKTAAILQGCFLILAFFFPEPVYPLFYAAAIVTGIELIEEILLVIILPKWKTNVKGLYWVMKGEKEKLRIKN